MEHCNGCNNYFNLKTLEKNDGKHCKKCYYDVLKELTIDIQLYNQTLENNNKTLLKQLYEEKKKVHIKSVNINKETCFDLLSKNNIFIKENDEGILDLDTGEYKDCKIYTKYADKYILEYKGDIIDKKKEGYGVYQYIDDYYENYEYKGFWKNGAQHGQGISEYLGDKYIGDWENGLHHGEGTTEYKNGNVYTGTYHLDKRTGKGKMVYVNGNNGVGHSFTTISSKI